MRGASREAWGGSTCRCRTRRSETRNLQRGAVNRPTARGSVLGRRRSQDGSGSSSVGCTEASEGWRCPASRRDSARHPKGMTPDEDAAGGDDPEACRRPERIGASIPAGTSLGEVVSEHIAEAGHERPSPSRAGQETRSPTIGHRPVNRSSLDRQERMGQPEAARRARAFVGRGFRDAVASAGARSDPASRLVGAVPPLARRTSRRSPIRTRPVPSSV
jgi:hypothetical protein